MLYVNIIGWKFRHKNKLLEIDRPNGRSDYLIIILHSPTTIYNNKKWIEVKSPACVLINRGSEQIYYATERHSNPEGIWTNDFIHFDGEEFKDFATSISFPFDSILNLTDNMANVASNDIKEISEEHIKADKLTTYFIDLKIKSLLLKIIRDYSNSQLEEELQINTTVAVELKKLRAYVYDNLSEEWTISKMASIVNLSESHFQKVYKELFKITPLKDITSRRLVVAKYYLGCTNMSIQQIAHSLGFKNEYYFIRLFKKTMGVSPGKYAKMRQCHETSNINSNANKYGV
jgi:AraC-like DNA-binding protein